MSSTKKQTTTTTNTRKKSTNSNSIVGLFKWLFSLPKHANAPYAVGLVGGILAIFMIIAFISYLFTGEADQSEVLGGGPGLLTQTNLHTNNWIGRLGTYLAHLFIYKGFGLTAFIIPFILLITAAKLIFKRAVINLREVYLKGIVALLVISAVLGMFFYGSAFPWGGAVGKQLADQLSALVGNIGAIILLLIALFFTLTWIFNWQINYSELANKNPEELLKGLKPRMPNFNAKTNTTAANNPSGNNKKNSNGTTTSVIEPTINETDKGKIRDSLIIEPNAPKNALETPQTTQPKSGSPFVTALSTENSKNNAGNDDILLEIVQNPRENYLPDDQVDHDNDDNPNPNNSNTAVGRQTELFNRTIPLEDEYDPTLELSDYRKPPLNLLEKYGRDLYEEHTVKINREELENNKKQIIETLRNYNIEIASISATPGPTITLYEIVPAPGVRISRIKNLEDDIALSLAALGIRIIAPIPGKGTVGIEVPNQNKEIVSLYSIISSQRFLNSKMALPVGLGKTISDEAFVGDLTKMPHLLMAGATGQGKSVCLNSVLVSLLYMKHPAELKFVMIDPKKVELSLYNMIENHFLAKLPNDEEAIVTDIKKVINTLNALCLEMDTRYDLLKKAHVRNIKEYNIKFKQRSLNPEKGHRYLPYIVLVIDEFADLIMTAGKEVEMPLARLAQLARAIGIHLVIATQRPTVNIITGTIKANFPVRIAFRVTSKIDSRTILDGGGAEQLVGSGDMLLSQGGNIVRLQGAFVDTHEVEKIAEFIAAQRGFAAPFLLPELREDGDFMSENDYFDDGSLDDLFEEAARIIVQHQQGSTSLLQRRLKLGYNRAGRLMDQLETAGIVGQNQGNKPREVLIPDEYELDKYLRQLKLKS